MDRINHLFRFYPTFFRLVLALLCCAALDRILAGRPIVAIRRALGTLAFGSLAVMYLGGWATGALGRLGGAPGVLLVLIPAVFLALTLIRPTPLNRGLLAGVILLVALADLGTYFRQVCRFDGEFTGHRRWVEPPPLPWQIAMMLKRPWAPLDPDKVDSLFDNMPIATEFWPEDRHLQHRLVTKLIKARGWGDPWQQTFTGFHPVEDPTWWSRMARDSLTPLTHVWRHRDYNRWSLIVAAPRAGWISVAQVYDPAWQATVDGRPVRTRRANFVRTAVPVDVGRHEVEMEYRPLSRRLYWPASLGLELALLSLGVGTWRAGRRVRPPMASPLPRG